MFVILVRELDQASSLTNIKLGWKTGINLAIAAAKCPNLTLLHTENQHHFVPTSSGKAD